MEVVLVLRDIKDIDVEICVLLEVMEVSVQKSVAVRMALALLWMVHVIAQWGTQGYTVTSHALQAQRVRTVPSTVTVQYMEPVISSLGYVNVNLVFKGHTVKMSVVQVFLDLSVKGNANVLTMQLVTKKMAPVIVCQDG